MNRILPLLVLFLTIVGLQQAYAQPTVCPFPDFIQIETGETTCIDFRTLDFTDIQEMRFSVRWNPDAVTFIPDPQNLNPMMTNLDLSDFTYDIVNFESILVLRHLDRLHYQTS